MSSSSGASGLPLPLRSSHPRDSRGDVGGLREEQLLLRDEVLPHRVEQRRQRGRGLAGRRRRRRLGHELGLQPVGDRVEQRGDHVRVALVPEPANLAEQDGIGGVAHAKGQLRQIELALVLYGGLRRRLGLREQHVGRREVLQVAGHLGEGPAVARQEKVVDLVDDHHRARDELAVLRVAVRGVLLLAGEAARQRRLPLPRPQRRDGARDVGADRRAAAGAWLELEQESPEASAPAPSISSAPAGIERRTLGMESPRSRKRDETRYTRLARPMAHELGTTRRRRRV